MDGGVGSYGRMAQPIVDSIVGEKGYAGVREHTGNGGGEAAVEVREAGAGGYRGRNDCG